jgi:hypothetical protein
MTLLVLLLAGMPCVYWTDGPGTRGVLDAAGIRQICVPPAQANEWRDTGLEVRAVAPPDLATRSQLEVPGITTRPGVASPTRSPWVVANGWRFARAPASAYVYRLPAEKIALALAEAFAWRADVALVAEGVDDAALAGVGRLVAFLSALPDARQGVVADVGIVDDGTPLTGEVMNLLARRNLLFHVVPAPSPELPTTIVLGTPAYPAEDAADPSAFALRLRRRITDERRRLRVFGSEVVLARVTGDATGMRIHLVNYGGREIEGLRLRVLGSYPAGEGHLPGSGRAALIEHVVTDGATEFSLPALSTYAVVDLRSR